MTNQELCGEIINLALSELHDYMSWLHRQGIIQDESIDGPGKPLVVSPPHAVTACKLALSAALDAREQLAETDGTPPEPVQIEVVYEDAAP